MWNLHKIRFIFPAWCVALLCISTLSCSLTDDKGKWEEFEGECSLPLLNEIKTEDFSPEEEKAFRAVDDLFAWYVGEGSKGRLPSSLEVFPRMEAIVDKGPVSVKPLLEIVRMGNRHSVEQIRELHETSYYSMAALMLGRLKATEAVNDLMLMATRRGFREWQLRAPAIKALGEIGDPHAIPIIEKATEDHHESVREAAKEAIERFRSSEQTL
ncbi:MAG: HEAT repeat domain-containing protein [bacterium]